MESKRLVQLHSTLNCIYYLSNNTSLLICLKIVYTLSKAEFSTFITWTDLGSKKHTTDAEVGDAVRVITQCVEEFNCEVASLAVDNAAQGVAKIVCEKLADMNILMLRDPGHCVDLLAKDLLKTKSIKRVVDDSTTVRDFVNTDRINAIRLEAIQGGSVDFNGGTVSLVLTRMNLGHDYILGARRQHDFLQLIHMNPSYNKYYQERTSTVKAKLDDVLATCRDPVLWQRMDMITNNITGPLKRVHQIVCRADVPLSAYVLLIQALKNELNKGLHHGDPGDFDSMLGDGSAQEIADMVRVRFNMNGSHPGGAKVGLLDRYHWWCFIVDPNNAALRNKIHVKDFALYVREMIEKYIPLDDDGKDTKRKEVKNDFLVRPFPFTATICLNHIDMSKMYLLQYLRRIFIAIRVIGCIVLMILSQLR